jgi:hypothetical protein
MPKIVAAEIRDAAALERLVPRFGADLVDRLPAQVMLSAAHQA